MIGTSGVWLLALSTIQLQPAASREFESPRLSDVDQTIPIGKHELWEESDQILLTQVMRCKGQSVAFQAKILPDSIIVTKVSLNDLDVEEVKRKEIESEIRSMGGFDYVYVVCTSTRVRIAFDRTASNGRRLRHGIDLN